MCSYKIVLIKKKSVFAKSIEFNALHEYHGNRNKYSFFTVKTWEAVTGGVLQKKVFLEISQNSQENTCARGVNRVAGPPLLKERLWHMCYPVSFAKFLRTPFLTEHLGGCFYLC